MARRASAQLALFDDLPKAPPPLPEALPDLAAVATQVTEPGTGVELFSPEVMVALEATPSVPSVPPSADRLALAVPISSRSGGSILAAGRQIKVSDAVLFSLRVSLLDLGPLDDLHAGDIEAIIAACSKVEMRRFDAVFPTIAPRFDGGPALFPDDCEDLDALLHRLRRALRAQDAPTGDVDDNGPHLPLGNGAGPGGQTSLDRPLKIHVREFALVRVFADGGYEVQRKWALTM